MNYKHMIRHGTVSTIHPETWTVTVTFPEYDDQVSGSLSVIKNPPTIQTTITDEPSHQMEHDILPWFPEVGDRVVCLFLPHGQGDGFVIGGI